ncbi:MAG: hypothetical protein JO083_09070 [Candidatus Eremiobacteraeota bacterium]|nr:hypothetical protein [Candidatus Eremiobacteraeota bacterium]
MPKRHEATGPAIAGATMATDRFVAMPVTKELNVLIEVSDPTPSGPALAAGWPRSETAFRHFQDFISGVGEISESVLTGLRSTLRKAESVEAEFHLTISGDANIVLVKAKTEALFSVKIKWSGARKDDTA